MRRVSLWTKQESTVRYKKLRKVYLAPYKLQNRLVTNGENLGFGAAAIRRTVVAGGATTDVRQLLGMDGQWLPPVPGIQTCRRAVR
jgi:hypothetical protein